MKNSKEKAVDPQLAYWDTIAQNPFSQCRLGAFIQKFLQSFKTDLENLLQQLIPVTHFSVVFPNCRLATIQSMTPLSDNFFRGVYELQEENRLGSKRIYSNLCIPIAEEIVSNLLGSSSLPIRLREHSSTQDQESVETHLISHFFKKFVSVLNQNSILGSSGFSFKFQGMSSNLKLIHSSEESEWVCVLNFPITLRGKEHGIQLIFPYSWFESLQRQLENHHPIDGAMSQTKWSQDLEWAVQKIELNLAFAWPPYPLSLKEILNFNVGHQITLPYTADSPIEALCEGKVKFQGRLGKRNQNIAVQLECCAHEQQ
jgi:flagellar motor switch protein FliM